ncbi:YceD family protein [Saccharomonospora saliphila]|uniref:YceD family protein n=1 Tax=Saccharomonospora saliphila TaxID=369829 RepID=UPI000370B3D9|nr:YceD family protein [Saccharomonospora saliphila]
MSQESSSPQRADARSPWLFDTHELGRSPGSSHRLRRDLPVRAALGIPDVVEVPEGTSVTVDLLLESVVEGVLVTGTASTGTRGQCSRCLDPLTDEVEVQLTELFAYPDSTTDETTDADEVSRIVDDWIDLEPLVRDTIVLALPLVPLCSDDCEGLCSVCGVKWADLEPGHGHETIDPRWAALLDRLEDTPGGDAAGGSDR